MIKFKPFVDYKLGDCFLTELECYGILMKKVGAWNDGESCDVMTALWEDSWTHRHDSHRNATIYTFGHYRAEFTLTHDREGIVLRIFDSDDDRLVMEHTIDDETDENIMMSVVDYLTYRDPELSE